MEPIKLVKLKKQIKYLLKNRFI